MRAVIYARYSTDKQSEHSLTDQFSLCSKLAVEQRYTVVDRFGDEAISGSTHVEARPQGRRLMASARSGRFDVLLVESLDRLSRDTVEQETILRRLEHWRIRIIGVSDGYDSTHGARKVTRAVRGIIADLYIEDLRKKTHRGLCGQVDRGMSAGGVSFGYRLVRQESGSSIEIDPDRAEWVRFIFAEYASGRSIQKIAHRLNELGVPSPRGRGWGVSALYGSPNKGSGVLNNELYVGRYIWNRSQWVMDPDTRKREREERPREEWRVQERPDLRIVDEETWRTVRLRIEGKNRSRAKGRGRPERTLFGGQLRCPSCGGAVIAVNSRKYGCGRRKDQGPTSCANGTLVRRDLVDQFLLPKIRDQFMSPAAVAAYEHELRNRLRSQIGANQGSYVEARLRELDAKIDRLVEAIADLGISDALRQKLRAAEAERQELRTRMPQDGPEIDADEWVRQAMSKYRSIVRKVERALKEDLDLAREALRSLLGRITLIVDEEGAIHGEYESETARAPDGDGLSLNVVAGAGFEPTTFGL